MMTPHRFLLVAAGIFGAIGIALGAFGAHGLQASLAERGMTHAWESAARYQMLHVVALLAAAAWVRVARGAAVSRVVWAGRLWCAGIFLFSGSLYWLATGGPRWLGPVTPLGGVAFIAGWLLIAAAAWAREE